jgi:hypothetical protein
MGAGKTKMSAKDGRVSQGALRKAKGPRLCSGGL